MNGIVKFIRSLFPRKDSAQTPVRPLPPRSEIVKMMHERSPSVPTDTEIVKVIYSADQEKRVIITRNRKHGFYQFRMERLCAWDDEEWLFISRSPDALPAMWTDFGNTGISFFGTEQEAWNELVNTPDYKKYFDQKNK